MGNGLNGLLYSRKMWLAGFGVVQALVLHYLRVPDDIWQAIVVLVLAVIAGITVEDAAEKHAPVTYVENYGPEPAKTHEVSIGVGGEEVSNLPY